MYTVLTKRLRHDEGFTLIELVVVLFILGLLIAVALPSYNQSRQTAARDEARVLGQEWRTLEWSCALTQGSAVTGTTCNNDSAIGFSENGTNWDFKAGTLSTTAGNTDVYQITANTTSGTVERCVPGKTSTNAQNWVYRLFVAISGTSAGSASDSFTNGGTCP